MAKRKPDPQSAAQMDMFGGWTSSPAATITDPALPTIEIEPMEVANDQALALEIVANDTAIDAVPCAVESQSIESQQLTVPTIAPVKLSNGWENDEWWTTAMVCAYLKLGRKAIWERTRHPTLAFPQPTHFGSCRHRWRAGEVKAWAGEQG